MIVMLCLLVKRVYMNIFKFKFRILSEVKNLGFCAGI